MRTLKIVCCPSRFLDRGISCIVGLALVALVSGCASESIEKGSATSPQNARDLAFQYRQEALALSRLADNLELEAEQQKQKTDSPESAARLSRIRDLRIRADAALERASEYRSQVPHNQMY